MNENLPRAYKLGYQDFYGFRFKVTKDVLIPRPETEFIVDAVLNLAGISYLSGVKASPRKLPSKPKILDVGTGSGCIAIAIKKKFPEAEVSAVDSSEKPLLITRDTLDILAVEGIEETFEKQNLILFGSMMQLQKIFRSIYYPRMILLSQPLIQVAETLHKFTLSYQCTIITLHNGQLLIAKNGKVVTIPLEKTNYSPITIWSGELAAKISVLNLYNPNMLLEASIAAIFSA